MGDFMSGSSDASSDNQRMFKNIGAKNNHYAKHMFRFKRQKLQLTQFVARQRSKNQRSHSFDDTVKQNIFASDSDKGSS